MIDNQTDRDEAWYITGRWQRYDGEVRANRVRVAAIVPFYLVHLLQHLSGQGVLESTNAAVEAGRYFHIGVTVLVAAWLAMSLAVELSLRMRVFPKPLGSITTCFDVLFVTAMMSLGGGQASPLMMCYPLIIALAALRMSLPLVYLATAISLLGYSILLILGTDLFSLPTGAVATVPRYSQVLTALAILIAGVVAGQMIRRVHVVANDYCDRVFHLRSSMVATDDTSQPIESGRGPRQ